MKAFFLAVASCLSGVAALHADLTIVQKIEGLGQATESVTKYKDGKTRMDVMPGATVIIMDAKTGETISLLPAQKRYFKAPANVVKAAVEGMQGESAPTGDGKPQLVPTGRKETIAGYPAEEYSATVSGSKIALWLTRAIPNYEQASRELGTAFKQGPLAAMSQGIGLDLANLPGFPVRQVKEHHPGQTITATLVSVSTQPIPAADFEVPADYQAIVTPELTPRAAVPEPRKTTP